MKKDEENSDIIITNSFQVDFQVPAYECKHTSGTKIQKIGRCTRCNWYRGHLEICIESAWGDLKFISRTGEGINRTNCIYSTFCDGQSWMAGMFCREYITKQGGLYKNGWDLLCKASNQSGSPNEWRVFHRVINSQWFRKDWSLYLHHFKWQRNKNVWFGQAKETRVIQNIETPWGFYISKVYTAYRS